MPIGAVIVGRPRKLTTKGKTPPPLKTVGFKATAEWVEWLNGAAASDRATVAAFLDRAAAAYAKQIGHEVPPPQRVD